MVRNIAIDGPGGAGKSTIARELAKRAGLIYVDTGAMYRALALYCREQGYDVSEEEQAARAMREAQITLDYENGEQQIYLNGENVSGKIRTEEISRLASAVSVHPPVREEMARRQKALASEKSVVMDGRDIGTVVLPDAFLKIFLTASARERARRRALEYEAKGKPADIDEIEKELKERDERDMTRAAAPLKQAEDAVFLDSTGLSPEEVLQTILTAYREKEKLSGRTVTVAPKAGFCFGVQRAMDQVEQLILEEKAPIYTYGPLIHNEAVVEQLEEKGVKVLAEDAETLPEPGSIVVIRSHGVGPEVYEKLTAAGCRISDATCPFVERIHKTVREESEKGRIILVAGTASHPEVKGITSCVTGEVHCIETPEELKSLSLAPTARVCMVAQTTFNAKKFEILVANLKKMSYDSLIVNTICSATQQRQNEARKIAAASDTMIVVGGKQSSNTQKLYEICKSECDDTFFIQTADDLRRMGLHLGSKVGITAGASTPGIIIEEVRNKCQS